MAQQEFECQISQFIFTNKRGDFVICRTKKGEVAKGNIVPGDLVTNGSYRFVGEWVEDKKYGKQFNFRGYIPVVGRDRNSVIDYLVRTCPQCGIGRATAMRIVDRFGPDHAVEVLRTSPQNCVGISPGFRLEHATKASNLLTEAVKWEATKIDLMSIFTGRGFPGTAINECIQKWGVYAPLKIRRDPLSLLVHDISGAGFQRVAKLYSDMGHSTDRLKFQMICIWNIINNSMSGSTWYSLRALSIAVGEQMTISRGRLQRAVKLGIRSGWFRVRREDEVWIAIAQQAAHEEIISLSLNRIMNNGQGILNRNESII